MARETCPCANGNSARRRPMPTPSEPCRTSLAGVVRRREPPSCRLTSRPRPGQGRGPDGCGVPVDGDLFEKPDRRRGGSPGRGRGSGGSPVRPRASALAGDLRDDRRAAALARSPARISNRLGTSWDSTTERSWRRGRYRRGWCRSGRRWKRGPRSVAPCLVAAWRVERVAGGRLGFWVELPARGLSWCWAWGPSLPRLLAGRLRVLRWLFPKADRASQDPGGRNH
jgi:hypothetical protein